MKKLDWLFVGLTVIAIACAGALYARKIRLNGPADYNVAGKALPPGLVAEGTEVIAVLTPVCPYCASSVGAWNQLVASGVKVVGVSGNYTREEVDEFKRTNGADFPILIANDDGWAVRLGMDAVPYTLTLSTDGRIRHAYRGWLKTPDPVFEALGK